MLSFLFAGRNDRIHARLSADAHGPRLPASPLRMRPVPPGSYFPPLIGVDINSAIAVGLVNGELPPVGKR